jgi:hypothetical protein
MRTILLGDGVPPWHVSCRRFKTGSSAKAAFGRVHNGEHNLGVGVYRHMRQGLDKEPVLVSVVGLDADKVQAAEELLGGDEIELHPQTWLELIKRRLEVVIALDAAGAEEGRYRIPHSEGGDRLA